MVWVKKRFILFIFILLLVPCISYAKENIIINSKDWKDVYSGMQYGYFTGQRPFFISSVPNSIDILNGFPKEDSLLVLSSRRNAFVKGYESTIRGRGFENVDETVFNSLSLELAEKLENVTKFIIIDDSYGYNAIAVAPYSIVSNSYVLFADNTNIVEVEDFLDRRGPDEILIYGHVDREVLKRLEKFSPEIINLDGDRFANNVEIVKKYMEIKEVGQVLLTNGEFIESSLLSGEYPTLFIGKDNVPEKIREYIQESPINTGVLIGNDLVSTATVVRRQAGISVFVKFARSARNPTGPINQVEDLDLFAVPVVSLNLSVSNVRFNKLTNQIEITYRNNADVVTYFKGSYTLIDGENQQTFGDLEPIFIAANSFKTEVYDVEPLLGEEATLDLYTIFGESKASLEFILQGTVPISFVEINDETKITLTKAYYSIPKQAFYVEIENTGEKDVYVDTEIIDIILQKERTTLSSDETIFIKAGKKKLSKIPAILDETDINDNPTIRVRAYYGERENVLVKIIEGDFDLVVRTTDIMTYLPTILLVLLIILIIYAILKRKCPNCGHKNARHKKRCKKCGTHLKK